MIKNKRIAVIGLGYVGLPLALEFGKKFSVLGFDIDIKRIEDLRSGFDKTLESSTEQILESENLQFSSDPEDLINSNIYIVTVPTPIDIYKSPDLKPLLAATKMISKYLKIGDIVIYESTVYPGCTEEECVPVLEKESLLKYNVDFYCGYSPERINPGDKKFTLTKIKKVTSGSNPEVAKLVDNLYSSIILAGTHLAPSIKVAEASKAIENAQRDINISFVNELALIFDKIGIDTQDVLDAAGTKWNFLKYKPGLVGGHCIGVDPYYLAHKAESLGYYPQVILSGRRVNDNMGVFVANKLIKALIKNKEDLTNAHVLILGVTFKENCLDIRNSKIIDVYNELIQFGLKVDVYDPLAIKNQVFDEYGISLISEMFDKKYDAIILAVAHNIFFKIDFKKIKKNEKSILFDLKSFLNRDIVNLRL